MKRNKYYRIIPEYIDNFGSEAFDYTVITQDDIEFLARGWDCSEDEIKRMLIRISSKEAYRLYRICDKEEEERIAKLHQPSERR